MNVTAAAAFDRGCDAGWVFCTQMVYTSNPYDFDTEVLASRLWDAGFDYSLYIHTFQSYQKTPEPQK